MSANAANIHQRSWNNTSPTSTNKDEREIFKPRDTVSVMWTSSFNMGYGSSVMAATSVMVT